MLKSIICGFPPASEETIVLGLNNFPLPECHYLYNKKPDFNTSI